MYEWMTWYNWYYILSIVVTTSAHTLARSLHDVSCANNNRFAVVVCFRLAFHASRMRFFFWNFRVKNFAPLWWRNNSIMSQHIWDLFLLPFFYHKDPYRIIFSRFYLLWGVRFILEIGWLPQISNMLTHHWIITSS